MRPYLAVLSARFRTLLQYRVAAVAGFATQICWGFIRFMTFEAFYRSTDAVPPMTYEEMVAYVWLGQALLGMLPWNPDAEVRDMIRSGAVAYELARPVDLYGYWYARAVALRLAPLMLRTLPVLVLAWLFFDMPLPADPEAAFAWLAATVLAIAVSAAMTTLITLSMLWSVSGEGISNLMTIVVMVCSGMIIPLPLFPDWAQPVLNTLPFRALMDGPFRLYSGHIPLDEAMAVFAHQVIWLALLIRLGRFLLRRGVHRLVVKGG
ncbi:MAG: ABC-2 family transporter protein [candidate division Zixibacteria bacterium]|nr:ABC-2 family transporter protein [candidate division Zixibacteria bacterium]